MDPQTLQALMGVFQQGLQILQSAQAGAGAPPTAGAPAANGAPPMAAGAPPAMDPDDEDMMEEDDEDMDAPEAMDADDEDDMDDSGMGGSSLHDRVSQLENHTGLKKSARGGSLLDAVAALEETILGTEYEGPLVDRVNQLEKAAGISQRAQDQAPDEIPLENLIKSAIESGIQQAMATRDPEDNEDPDAIPDLRQMRKAAKGQRYGSRKGVAGAIVSDEDLVKSAASLGWDGDDLDRPVSFGDALLLQYHSQQAGEPLPFSADEADDD
jgi:hypothetical protein